MPNQEYNTKQKDCVLRCLRENADRALTIDEVTQLLHLQGEPVGKTTVYRRVEKLVESGEVRKFNDESGQRDTFQMMEDHNNC